jgi:hypothetical protein
MYRADRRISSEVRPNLNPARPELTPAEYHLYKSSAENAYAMLATRNLDFGKDQ